QLGLRVEERKEKMRSAGLFEPVGIDGLETEYTLAEWQKIANAGIHRGYYELNFPDRRPEDWPENFEEAVNTATGVIEESGRLPIIGINPFNTIIFRHIGLVTPRDKKRSEWRINKTLLLNMGRIPAHEARSEILDAAVSQLKEKYPVGFKDEWSSITIMQLNYVGKPLDECLNDLIQKAGNINSYKLLIAPELANRKVNISLRKLDALRCLTFITQQVGCAVVAELPIGDEVVLHILDVK
ncbi:MAG: hypothetical protein R6U56_04920, partial [Opitutales bacterium]